MSAIRATNTFAHRSAREAGGRRPHPYVLALLAVELAIVAAFVVLEAAPPLPMDTPLRLVDLDGEANFVVWFSSTQLLVAAVPWGVLALLRWRALPGRTPLSRLRSSDRACWAPAAIALLLVAWSIDESALLHEAVGEASDILLPGGQREGTPFDETGVGLLLFAVPLLLLAGGLVRASARLFPFGALRLFVGGLLLFIGSASLGDFAGNVTVDSEAWRTWQFVGEELGEMIGVTLMLWASYRTLSARAQLTIATRAGPTSAGGRPARTRWSPLASHREALDRLP
ncbi:MAG: hypothetical protein O3C25_00435 [Chloroflexi bacterium]|nr:hypothetical protein [Chloroflexota bacterium]